MMKLFIQLRKKTWLPLKRKFWIRKYSKDFSMAAPEKVFQVKQQLEQELIEANTRSDDTAKIAVSKALSTFNEVITYGSPK